MPADLFLRCYSDRSAPGPRLPGRVAEALLVFLALPADRRVQRKRTNPRLPESPRFSAQFGCAENRLGSRWLDRFVPPGDSDCRAGMRRLRVAGLAPPLFRTGFARLLFG